MDSPERVSVERVALRQPSALVERDERGGFPLRALLPTTVCGAR